MFLKQMVNYQINKKLDKKMAAEFIEEPDFSEGILELHPKLKKVKKAENEEKKERIISDYFDKFYEENSQKLEQARKNFGKKWSRAEEDFIEKTKELFGEEYEFPDGEYTGYISAINCNPRFLEDKTFQVYFQHPQGVKYVTAHEFLHFAFYDYTQEKFPDLFEDKNPNKGTYWDLAEIFNDVVLATKEFRNVHEQNDIPVYPDHEQYLEEFTKLWEKTEDVDKFIVNGYEILKEA